MQQEIIDLLQSEDIRNVKIGIIIAKNEGYNSMQIFIYSLNHHSYDYVTDVYKEVNKYRFNIFKDYKNEIRFVIHHPDFKVIKSTDVKREYTSDNDKLLENTFTEYVDYFINLILNGENGTTTD